MATVGLGFQLSASAAGMSSGINAGVVELQKLGFAAKRASQDLSTLKTLQISQLFVSSVRAVTSGFQQFTSGAASAIDQTNKLSRSLGLSFDELQQLKLAADLSGASTEQLAQAFGRAQITIGNAQQGSKSATDALRRLGLSVGELASLSASQQFEKIATAIAGIDDPARRSAAAVSIFGRSGVQLLPVFQELSQNLQTAESFFSRFTTKLSEADAKRVTQIKDAFTQTNTAVQQLAGVLLSRLEPALTAAAKSVEEFIQGIDVDRVAGQAAEALRQFAAAGELLARVAGVVLQRPLLAAGVALAFINRQAVQFAVVGLQRNFLAAAAAAGTFSVRAAAAAIAANVLKVALRGLAAATVVGAVGVALGFAAEAALNFVAKSKGIGVDVGDEIKKVADETKKATTEFGGAADAAVRFGQKARDALKVPQLDASENAQAALNDAKSAVNSLARELGGLSQVPIDILADFSDITLQAQEANKAVVNQKQLLRDVQVNADAFTKNLKEQVQLQKDNADAARRTAEEVQRAGQEAQRRTQELAVQGLTGAEQSRLKLNQDLARIALEQVNAEKALAAARQQGDFLAIRAAEERLRNIRLAVAAAKEQDRDRRLDALGISRSLLEPVKTVRDQIRDVRQAFDKGLIDPEQLKNALANLADEGIKIRQDIDKELSRPSAQALRISDIRSSEGLSQFLQTQRRDPALDQRERQLETLREIRQALRDNNFRVAELVG
jgi:hypothetical protein